MASSSAATSRSKSISLSREAARRASMISSARVAGGAWAAFEAFASRPLGPPRESLPVFFSGFSAPSPLSVGGWVALIVSCSPWAAFCSELGDEAREPDAAEPRSVSSVLILIKDRQGVPLDVLENALEPRRSVHLSDELDHDAPAAEAGAVRESPQGPVEAGGGNLERVLRETLLEGVEDLRSRTRGCLAVLQRHTGRLVHGERQRGA